VGQRLGLLELLQTRDHSLEVQVVEEGVIRTDGSLYVVGELRNGHAQSGAVHLHVPEQHRVHAFLVEVVHQLPELRVDVAVVALLVLGLVLSWFV